eukprot:3228521-Pyramimonas_sp.AAC.1
MPDDLKLARIFLGACETCVLKQLSVTGVEWEKNSSAKCYRRGLGPTPFGKHSMGASPRRALKLHLT